MWAYIKKTINDLISPPLNEQLGTIYDEDGNKYIPVLSTDDPNDVRIIGYEKVVD